MRHLRRLACSNGGRLCLDMLSRNRGLAALVFAMVNLSALCASAKVLIFVALLQSLGQGQERPAFADWLPFLPDDRRWLLAALMVATAAVTLVSLYLDYSSRRLTARFIARLTRALRRLAVSHAFRLDAAFFAGTKVGEVSARLFSPVNAAAGLINSGLMLLKSVLQVAMLGVAVLLLSPAVTLALGATTPLLALFAVRFHRRLARESAEAQALDIRAGGIATDVIYGMRIIKQCGQEHRLRGRFLRNFAAIERQRVRVADMQAAGNAVMQGGALGLVALVAGVLALLRSTNILGDVGFAIGYLAALWRLVNELLNLAALVNETAVQVPYLVTLGDSLADDRHLEDEPLPPGRAQPVPELPAIEAREVSFAYHGDARVLKSVSFSLEPGSRTALVGLSGSGKTTLLELLARLRPLQDGALLLNGTDIREFDLGGYRRSIGYVNQEAILFHDTVLENIRFGNPRASLDEVRAAAERACAHEFITGMAGGYDALLGERGQMLSGGQRQRIVLARTLVQRPRLLLLDEATSALDIRTERRIFSNLFDGGERPTVVVATHRLVTISGFDRILFIHDGQVVENGTHESLMAAQGMYFDLFRFQSAAAEQNLRPDLEYV